MYLVLAIQNVEDQFNANHDNILEVHDKEDKTGDEQHEKS